jgi:hypothetical protein
MDTPGEQHKYAIALIETLYKHLPPQATVTLFYDIGCAIDRSIWKVSCSLFVRCPSVASLITMP